MRSFCALVFIIILSGNALAQSSVTPSPASPTPYGTSIDLSMARRVIDAAEKEAKRENWPVAIAVVDPAGFLVAFAKLDNTQLGSIEVAIEKARTSALYRRTTKELEDRLTAGGANLKVLRLPGLPIEGGIPIIVDGKIIGGIGVSGVQSTQDAQVATAGVMAVASPATLPK